MSQHLGIANPAIAGAVVAELYAVAAGVVMATHTLSSRAAMLAGLVLLVPSVGLLLLAQITTSIAALLIGTAMGGAALALAYRGSLQVINGIAPEDRRAELEASYMIVCFLGWEVRIEGPVVDWVGRGRTRARGLHDPFRPFSLPLSRKPSPASRSPAP